eukprot:TRINITY_DN6743_c0_g1_i3.p1 TRINITY_DN6743_c0_g1~~TRINITY_DN6743_c0_g1_i3.p1  ORF type:complete len:299 (+),score=56.96 TRINITY_DN6743_c0_g1_i3:138-1034(+)
MDKSSHNHKVVRTATPGANKFGQARSRGVSRNGFQDKRSLEQPLSKEESCSRDKDNSPQFRHSSTPYISTSLVKVGWQKKLNKFRKDSFNKGDYGHMHDFYTSLRPVLTVNSRQLFITKTKTSVTTGRSSVHDYVRQLEEVVAKLQKHIAELEDRNALNVKCTKKLEKVNGVLKGRIKSLQALNEDLLELLSQAGASVSVAKADSGEESSSAIDMQVKLGEALKEKDEAKQHLENAKNENETLRKLLKIYKEGSSRESPAKTSKEINSINSEHFLKIPSSKFHLTAKTQEASKKAYLP